MLNIGPVGAESIGYRGIIRECSGRAMIIAIGSGEICEYQVIDVGRQRVAALLRGLHALD